MIIISDLLKRPRGKLCKSLIDYSEMIQSDLGKGPTNKSDEFSEKCERGEASFSNQKFMLQILDLYTGFSTKKLQHNCPKMGGGGKAVRNFFENSSVLEMPPVPKYSELVLNYYSPRHWPRRD